jgi:hypothetical protein
MKSHCLWSCWSLLCTMLVVAVSAEPSGPELGLRINGSGGTGEPTELFRGEPIILEVVLRHPVRGAKEPIVLQPPAGNWASRVQVEVTDDTGKAVPWTFIVTGKTSVGGLSLQPDALTTLVMRMDLKDSHALVPGKYQVEAKLNLPDGTAWRGTLLSEPVRVELVNAPAEFKGKLLGRRQELRVRDAILAGEMPRAEEAMRDMLRVDPDRPEGFVAMAMIAEAKGERGPALLAIDMAITRVVQGDTPFKVDPSVFAEAKPAATNPRKPATRPASPRPPAPVPPAQRNAPKVIPFEYLDLRERIENMPDAAGAGISPQGK